MNYNTVVSAIAASDLSGKEGVLLKITATGVDVAGASDLVIGTLVRGAVTGAAAAVFLTKANGLSFAQVGNATAIASGDLLEQSANGTLVKKTTGASVAIAWESAPAGSNGGGQIRVLFI